MAQISDMEFKSLLKKVENAFSSSFECNGLHMNKSLEGANNFEKSSYWPGADDTKESKKYFHSILRGVKCKTLKPWSDRQDEFIVLICHDNESFNLINCLSVMSAFAKGDIVNLEKIKSIAVQHTDCPNAGFLMNNLGVMFAEIGMYKMSAECFGIAKNCFEYDEDHEGGHLGEAVVTLNLAALHKVLGEYQRAKHLCNNAATLCHDISMRTPKDTHLQARLLRRVADMSEEFGNYKKFHEILKIGVLYDIGGTSTVSLTKCLMKIQLKEQCGERIEAKELKDFTSHLSTLMDKPAAVLLNAEFMRTAMIAAKVLHKTGHLEEACKLLGKLEATFLLVRGRNDPLCGTLLIQIGRFNLGAGMFSEAESVFKQAEEILIHIFGTKHHLVGSCKSLLGTCAVLMNNNTTEGLKHLNEALVIFTKINHDHPEVAEILLKLALHDVVGKGKFHSIQNTTEEAMHIFRSACGETSLKTAGGYFQLGMILQKVNDFKTFSLAVENIKKAIEIFLNLGMKSDHPDVMRCQNVLGALQLQLGEVKDAEECFVNVQKQASLLDESCTIRGEIISPEVTSLYFQEKSDHGTRKCSYRSSQIVSLVNLVCMKTGDDRKNNLGTLVRALAEHEMEMFEIWNFAGQNLYYISHRVHMQHACDKSVFCILFLDPKPKPSRFTQDLNFGSLESDDDSNSNVFILSSSKMSPCILFWRNSCDIQEMKEVKNLHLTLRESVNTLFLQPKFRKVFEEGKDFYMELRVPKDLCGTASLCSQIDYLPLLVEQELSESYRECVDFDDLTSWAPSTTPKSSVHVSYFSYKFSNQREAELVFDRLIFSLGRALALNKVQVVEISSTPSLQNVAFYPFQEPRNSSLSVVVDSEFLVVKCRTLKESESSCVCSSVQNALENAVKSLCELVRVNREPFVQLHCEGIASDDVKDFPSAGWNLNVKTEPSCSSAGVASETVDPLMFTDGRDQESDLVQEHSVDNPQNQDAVDAPPVSHQREVIDADMDVCLCLLDCLLSDRPALPEEEAQNSRGMEQCSCGCSPPVHHNHSFFSVGSASSLNSLPVSPSTFSESWGPLMQRKASSDNLSSVSKLKGRNPQAVADQNDSEEFVYRKHSFENSSAASVESKGLHVKMPEKSSQFSDGVDLSSCEEVLSTDESYPDPKSEDPHQVHVEDSSQLQIQVGKVDPLSDLVGKSSMQSIHGSDAESCVVAVRDVVSPLVHVRDVESSVVHVRDAECSVVQVSNTESCVVHVRDAESCVVHVIDTESCEVQVRDTETCVVHVREHPQQDNEQSNANQKHNTSTEQFESITEPSCTAVSGDDAVLSSLKDELAATRNQCHTLGEKISQLEEKLKQSESEKHHLQAELGRYQFLEDKERRNERLLLSMRAGGSEKSRPCGNSASPVLTSTDGRLLGGAASLQGPSFPMQARLLEISNSLSTEELKQMKFLAKSKVSGFRLARIREGYELFEELETKVEHPHTYIGQLLEGIQRLDLSEKLGLPVHDSVKTRSPDNSAESLHLKDNSSDVPPGSQDREMQLSDETLHFSTRAKVSGFDQNSFVSVLSSRSSDNTGSDILNTNAEKDSLSSQAAFYAEECTQFPSCSDDGISSNASSCATVSSPDLLAGSVQTTQALFSTSNSQHSHESSVNPHSAATTNEVSSDSGFNPTSSEEDIVRSSKSSNINYGSEKGDAEVARVYASNSGDNEERPVDWCDGAMQSEARASTVGAAVSFTDSSTCADVIGQTGSNVGNAPWWQQSSFADNQMSVSRVAAGAYNGPTPDWERLGARPKQSQLQRPPAEQVPQEFIVPVADGLTGDFLARHSQDRALHQSLYQDGSDMSLFNYTPAQGASFVDGMATASETRKAKPYFGECKAASVQDPYGSLGNPLLNVTSGGFERSNTEGGFSYNQHFNGSTGHVAGALPIGNRFPVHGNHLSQNTLNAANSYSLQSGFVHNPSRFAGVDHFGREPYIPLDGRLGLYSSVHGSQPFHSGMTGSSFAGSSWLGVVGSQPGHFTYGTQIYTGFSDNTSTIPPEQDKSQTSQNTGITVGDQFTSATNSDYVLSASAENNARIDIGNSGLPAPSSVSRSNGSGVDSSTTGWPALNCASSNMLTVGSEVAAQGAADGNTDSLLEGCHGDANNSTGGSMLNRDFGTDSVESTDNSLLALEQRVAEACALVERVIREREEREQFGREIERKEQMIREQRARERREREEREMQEAARWPQQQDAITPRSQWLCEHYQRYCRVRFPCCTQFYPCHRCHNNSRACDNEEAKACHATHLKCSHCHHEQEIGEDSAKCRKCGGKMSAYFCSICKHFTSVDKNPYHCDKCGICRIHEDKSFHCEVCNVCLDKRLQGNHKCRPDSGHDECCICLEDAFSGCQILPCSHKVHRECAIAMIQNGIRTCPICRHPLYSPRE